MTAKGTLPSSDQAEAERQQSEYCGHWVCQCQQSASSPMQAAGNGSVPTNWSFIQVAFEKAIPTLALSRIGIRNFSDPTLY